MKGRPKGALNKKGRKKLKTIRVSDVENAAVDNCLRLLRKPESFEIPELQCKNVLFQAVNVPKEVNENIVKIDTNNLTELFVIVEDKDGTYIIKTSVIKQNKEAYYVRISEHYSYGSYIKGKRVDGYVEIRINRKQIDKFEGEFCPCSTYEIALLAVLLQKQNLILRLIVALDNKDLYSYFINILLASSDNHLAYYQGLEAVAQKLGMNELFKFEDCTINNKKSPALLQGSKEI